MKTAAKSLLTLALTLHLSVGSAFAAEAPLAYSAELLISRYASWGIDPDKHLASINLKESWTKFKKNKEKSF